MKLPFTGLALLLTATLLLVSLAFAQHKWSFHYQYIGPVADAQCFSEKQLFNQGPPLNDPIQTNLFSSRYAQDRTVQMDAVAAVNPPSPLAGR